VNIASFFGKTYTDPDPEIFYKHIPGGNVPGGHNVIYRDNEKNPFITPMKECNSIELRHTDVVVDIGAYVGTFAIRCARFPVKKVTAYEPTRKTHEILSLTKLPNMEVIHAAVVGVDIESVDINISKGIGVTNSIILGQKSKAKTENVKAVQYTDAIKHATVVKIDVEGAEYQYSGKLISPSMRAIVVDFHKIPAAKGDWVAKSNLLLEEIYDHGFKPIISPKFNGSGWEQAGSWIRDVEQPTEVYEPMMAGLECCGCATPIKSTIKSLCSSCYDIWSPKHKQTFGKAQ